jgi:hypothetical protein
VIELKASEKSEDEITNIGKKKIPSVKGQSNSKNSKRRKTTKRDEIKIRFNLRIVETFSFLFKSHIPPNPDRKEKIRENTIAISRSRFLRSGS